MSQLYTFHPLADAKQDEIWRYTYQQWGEEQADKYIDGLHAILQTVAEDIKHPKVRTLPAEVVSGVFFVHYGRHYVFFRLAAMHLPECIQVLSILHDSMDIPARIREELDTLERGGDGSSLHETRLPYPVSS